MHPKPCHVPHPPPLLSIVAKPQASDLTGQGVGELESLLLLPQLPHLHSPSSSEPSPTSTTSPTFYPLILLPLPASVLNSVHLLSSSRPSALPPPKISSIFLISPHSSSSQSSSSSSSPSGSAKSSEGSTKPAAVSSPTSASLVSTPSPSPSTPGIATDQTKEEYGGQAPHPYPNALDQP